MIEFIEIAWFLIKTSLEILLLTFFVWSFWHGAKITTGGIEIELYGIGRFFNK